MSDLGTSEEPDAKAPDEEALEHECNEWLQRLEEWL